METVPAHPKSAVSVLCAGQFLIGLDVTVLNVALPSLQAELEPGMSTGWAAAGSNYCWCRDCAGGCR
ncbi:hypothetical protein SALBM311S_11359 [Streptomyces alboniger]